MSGRTIALIPARGGSKRFPGKNVQPFNGKPLAYWTLSFCTQSGLFDEIYLNTDMPEISAMAGERVRQCPRPESLAGDSATLLDVIRYTCDQERFSADDLVVLLPVTGPLRRVEDVRGAIEKFRAAEGERTAVSVCESPYPAAMLFTKDDDDVLSPLFRDQYKKTLQKQRHAKTYQFNDLFVIDRVAGFREPDRNLFGDHPLAVEIPPERSMPIDYSFQFQLAEFLHARQLEKPQEGELAE